MPEIVDASQSVDTMAYKQGSFRRITVIQGQRFVSRDPSVMLTTVLGSCVSVCLYDPKLGIGGMNHFLLSEPRPGQEIDKATAQRYGVHAMELLINDMLQQGADRRHLRAHLYGGANLFAGMEAIGTTNAAFAVDFLHEEGIAIVSRDLGGRTARRVDFLPGLGRSRARRLKSPEAQTSLSSTGGTTTIAVGAGDVELF